MEKAKVNDHFIRFPYRKEVRENGDVNNGGINLVNEPHRISEIHELHGADWLYDFIEKTNKPEGLFMTFGCVWGQEPDESICGYVDFSLRPNAPVNFRDDLASLDVLFYDYLNESMISQRAESPAQAIAYARQSLIWEITPLEIYGETYQKVTLVFRVSHHEAASWLFDHLTYFINSHYPSIHQSIS